MRNKRLHTVQRGSVPNAFEGKESLQTYLKVQKQSVFFNSEDSPDRTAATTKECSAVAPRSYSSFMSCFLLLSVTANRILMMHHQGRRPFSGGFGRDLHAGIVGRVKEQPG